MYDDQGKLILYSSDDRGKFKFKNLFGNPFYLFPGFQAFSGIFKTTHTKSTWKKPAFGTGLIRGTQGNHIEKWVAKCHFLIVKSRLFEPTTSNCLGLGPILRHFRPKLGKSIWLQLIFISKTSLLSKKSKKSKFIFYNPDMLNPSAVHCWNVCPKMEENW